jgi:hypothetical protein
MIAVLLASLIFTVAADFTTQFDANKECSSDAYFDLTNYSCTTCSLAAGFVPDTSSLDIYGNPTSCICGPGYFKEDNSACSDTVILRFQFADLLSLL